MNNITFHIVFNIAKKKFLQNYLKLLAPFRAFNFDQRKVAIKSLL